jgi:archaeal type IV pilus assembly protein PilA
MTQNNLTMKKNSAVSPVVGVMLMLVVTIIIAAVVTGFAGGLVSSQKAAPTLSMDVKVVNTGTWLGSGFYATVSGVSTPIPTSDIKIVTSWSTTIRNSTGGTISGGATVVPGASNVKYHFNGGLQNGTAPFGVGPGVGSNQSLSVGSIDSNPTNPFSYPAQQFGNYSLMQGTNLFATPAGAGSMGTIGSISASNSAGGYGITGSTYYQYTSDAAAKSWQSGETDPTQAVLGTDWNNLRAGDTVNVKVIHIPSGKVIFQKDVAVAEG